MTPTATVSPSSLRRADPALAPRGWADQGVANGLARLGLLAISCSLLASCTALGALPERLRTPVAPEPIAPWPAPDLRGYSNALKPTERVPIDPARQYDLLELIDVAQRVNPETRVAWEGARQAAIGVGLVESEYFPVLTLAALGGYQSTAFPPPKDVAPSGFCRVNLEQVVPVLNLRVFSSPCQVQTPKRRCALMVEATTAGTMVSHVVSPDWMRASTSLVRIESRRLS